MRVKLGEICEVKSGKRLPQGRTLVKENTGFPYLRLVDCGEKYPIENNIHFLERDVYEKIKQYKIFTNEVFLSVVGTIGIVGIIPEKFNGINLTENANKLIIKEEYKGSVNAEYLYYWLKSNTGQSAINKGTVGSIQPKLPMHNIEKFEIDLPDRKTQDKIVEILSGIDEQINRNNEIVKKLQVLGSTTYSKELQYTKTFKSIDFSKIKTGKEDANFATANGKYKFFTCSEDTFLCDEFAFEGKSILIAGNGNFNVKFSDGQFNAYQRVYVISNDEEYGNLYYTYLYNMQTLSQKANGSIIKFLTLDMLKNIPVPIFADCTNKLLNNIVFKMYHIEEQNKKLHKLKSNLLPLLVNGQLAI